MCRYAFRVFMSVTHTQYGTYKARFKHADKRYTKSFKDELDALVWERETRQKLALGLYEDDVVKSKHSLKKIALELFEETWEGKPNSQARKGQINCLISFFGANYPIEKVSTATFKPYVRHLVKKLKHQQSTINSKVSCMKMILKYAEQEGYIDNIPTLLGTAKCNNECRGYISEKEEAIIVPFMINHKLPSVRLFGEFFVWSMDTGFRPSESRRLKKEDVYFDDSGRWVAMLTRSKTNNWRVIPLTPRALDMFKRQTDEYPWECMTPKRIQNAWEHVRKFRGQEGNRDYKPYLSRHTTGSRLVQRGVDIYHTANVLGHKDLTSTQRYAKLSPTHLFSAIDKLADQPQPINYQTQCK